MQDEAKPEAFSAVEGDRRPYVRYQEGYLRIVMPTAGKTLEIEITDCQAHELLKLLKAALE